MTFRSAAAPMQTRIASGASGPAANARAGVMMMPRDRASRAKSSAVHGRGRLSHKCGEFIGVTPRNVRRWRRASAPLAVISARFHLTMRSAVPSAIHAEATSAVGAATMTVVA